MQESLLFCWVVFAFCQSYVVWDDEKWIMGLANLALFIGLSMKRMLCVVCLRKNRGVGGVYGNDDWRARTHIHKNKNGKYRR